EIPEARQDFNGPSGRLASGRHRKMLDVRFRGAAEVQDAPSEQGDDIAGTPVRRHPLVERDVAVIGRTELRPLDRRRYLRLIEPGSDGAMVTRIWQHQRLAISQITGP